MNRSIIIGLSIDACIESLSESIETGSNICCQLILSSLFSSGIQPTEMMLECTMNKFMSHIPH